MPDLQDLINRAQQGDKTAMESLLIMFQPLILRCSREAPVDEREDLKQDLNAKLIDLVRTYRMPKER